MLIFVLSPLESNRWKYWINKPVIRETGFWTNEDIIYYSNTKKEIELEKINKFRFRFNAGLKLRNVTIAIFEGFINILNKELYIDNYSASDTLIITDNTNNEFFKFKYPDKEIDEFMVYDDLLNIDEKYLQYYLIVGDSSYSLFPYLYNRVRYVNKNENSDVRETITLTDNKNTDNDDIYTASESESSATTIIPDEETLIANASDYNKKIVLEPQDRLKLYAILQMILAGTCEKISNLRHDKNIKTYLDCTNINDFDEKIYLVEGNEAKLNNEKQFSSSQADRTGIVVTVPQLAGNRDSP